MSFPDNSPKYAWMLFITIVLIGFGVGYALADEPTKPIEDCTWKPTQATGVYYKCEDNINGQPKKLVGEGVVTVVICGKPYFIEIDCKSKGAQ
jgi:hypothetical protein